LSLPRRAPIWLWAAVAGLIGLYLVVCVLTTLVRLHQPTEFVYGEAVVLAQVRQFTLGQPLYPPTTRLPLSVTAYTPLYYVMVSLVQRVTGDQTYLVGRLVSVTAMLGAAVLLAAGVRAVSGRWWGGLLAGGLFLTQNLTALLWAPIFRVDALALCFTLAGLALASAGRATLAALPLAAAVLTKQTYVVGILSVCVQVLPRRRALLAFACSVVVAVAVALGVGQLLSGGWMLWHTVVANANPLDFDYFSAMFNAFIQLNALPVIAAAALLATPALPCERLWRAYFVLSAIEALFTIGKLGASSNYWLELTAATAAMIGIQAARNLSAPLTSAGLASVTLAALLTALPGYAATMNQTWQLASGEPSPQLAVAQLVAAERGEVLTDDPGLAVLAGKPVEFEFIIFTILAAQHVWDETPILQAIAAHRFSLVILSQPLDEPQPPLIAARWSPTVRDALLANYVPTGEDGSYWFYRPLL
jgi:hypothetical protein